MARIEKLTAEQSARMAEFRDEWTRIGLCTSPADRPAAERAIGEMYRAAGLEPPKKIVWCGSPLSQGLTRAIILDKKLLPASVRASVGASVRASVWASVGASVWASVWDSVRDSVGDSVRDSVRDSVWASVRASVWASVRASVWDSVGASVRASVGASVRASVWDSVGASVWDSVWDSVGDSVRDSVRASVGASVRASVWDSVRDSVGDSVRDSVRDSVWASVRASVWDSVRASVGDSVRASVGASVYGQHDANWLAFYDFFARATGLTEQTKKLEGLWLLARSAGWAIPHKNICWVSERHNVLERDDRGRLHNLAGPACAFPDGWAIYAVHGVRVPADVIEDRSSITVKRIDAEKNAEVRRVMIDLFGVAKYLQESGAQKVHEDKDPLGLPRVLWRKPLEGDEPILMVQLANSSLEPDGSRKPYFLRVHPECRPLLRNQQLGEPQELTALNAVASTFGMKGEDYRLAKET